MSLLWLGLGFTETSHAAETAAVSKADKIISAGKKYLGVKYKFGAPAGVTYAFDCSSFTQFIYKRNGISLPRTAKSQATRGHAVSKANLKKGDLVFFKVKGRSGIAHVAVYVGNNKILHTYGKGGVTYSNLNSAHWKKNYIKARRVI
ncbi:NlpC/P60 family protein [Paenibacillaceae bacterium]|nr:NlpC/P60 family protein [Paenibacillaceae bacterium]